MSRKAIRELQTPQQQRSNRALIASLNGNNNEEGHSILFSPYPARAVVAQSNLVKCEFFDKSPH
ncbi:uncharacterized protein N7469_000661 [Penicillium citrinum]|uniref:Uncharacterized protein n=2 Tax=Penicillium TaxID=5073 RepID=A0A9W9TVL4_PENCI|nr:uncharacterized protein N7469_000661 [Penicillium citrinum]KAJ5242334.1 hypothetical protein N7469_000661 [Penicillium citrinum]KAJ5600173.1 hypothetical protein N7450_001240 [Penicillium hetheringtonii]KAK5807002.1 hypothetical protein VI817_001260 [Penicillium citrinum]